MPGQQKEYVFFEPDIRLSVKALSSMDVTFVFLALRNAIAVDPSEEAGFPFT